MKREEEGHGDDWIDEAIATRPFGRLLPPHDIAHAAAYFASDDSALRHRQRARPRAVRGRRARHLVIRPDAQHCPRISSVFPKCYFDDFVAGTRDYLAWIRDAPTLGGEGHRALRRLLPHRSTPPTSIRSSRRMAETGQPTSLLCFSPDFTHPDADERARQVERQKAAIDLTAAARRPALPHAQRPALSRA